MGVPKRYVGKNVQRIRDPFLVTGRAQFVDDIHLPGMLHAAILRSIYAHARIDRIDVSKASAHPGVVTVLTGSQVKDLSNPIPHAIDPRAYGGKYAELYSLAQETVRYVGEPIVAVAAVDKFTAHEALGLIDVEYSPLPVVVDAEKALEPSSPKVFEEWDDNLMLQEILRGGDLDKAFREADHIIKGKVKVHRHTGTPIEPRAYVANYDSVAKYLTFWASTQQPHPLRTALAETLRMSENNIRVIQPHVGGGYGLKTPTYQEEPLIAILSKLSGRPVKWFEDRRENFLAGGHAREQIIYYEVAFTKEGIILGLRNNIIADVGIQVALDGWGMAFVTAYHIPAVYKIRNLETDLHVVVTNKAPWNAYRGYGKECVNFLMERIMDEIARYLKKDKAEVRLLNFVQPNEFPYEHPSGATLDSGNYPKALKRVLEKAGVAELYKDKERLRKEGRYLGIGMCYEVTPEGACIPDSFATGYDGTTVKVSPSGEVTVLTGITSLGSGNETMIAQVVADELGVDIENVSVVQGDTLSCPYGLGNFSSRSTIVGASSASMAAFDIKAKLLKVASRLLKARFEDLDIAHGKIFVKESPGKNLPLKDVAWAAYRRPYDAAIDIEPGLEVTRYYRTPNAHHIPNERGLINTYPSYANQANVAVVEVDIETGQVRLLKYFVVHDCGVVINPMMVEGQQHGGIAQGVGGALFEELVYDENGQLLTTTFMDYPIPTAREMPWMEIEDQVTPSPFTVWGTKGSGESGTVGVSSAVASAIEDALSHLGIRITASPYKPNNIWRLIVDAKSSTP